MAHDHMIETLAPNGTNHSLYIGSLPRRARCRQNFADAHVSHLFPEVLAKDSIAVAQQVARECVKGKCLPQLLSGPFRRWVGGHIEVDYASAVMGQYQEHVKNLETKRGHGKEIDGDQLLGMILQECAPGLRWRLAAADYVFTHAGLTDSDAQLAQFTMDAWCTPSGVFAAHPADQVADFAGKRGSSRLASPNLPGPEETKASAMPGDDRLGSNDGQRRAPVAPDAGQAEP